MEIYLDNSATTKISPAAARAMIDIIENVYGNPSSLHTIGKKAADVLSNARVDIAGSIGASKIEEDREIIFTSGGTEANNLAVLGAARARKRRGNRIVTTAVEHSSVIESCRELESEGFEVIYLKPDENGHISVDDIRRAVDKNTVLVTMMYVNNEIGSVFPVEKIQGIIKRSGAPALFHCDAVQAYGKLPVKVKNIGCDLMTISAHKIHGPKGCGALYKRKGTHIKPLVYGGEQEWKVRPGTEALPLIAGFAAAARELDGIPQNLEKIARLRDYTLSGLLNLGSVVQNSPDDALAYIINVSAIGFRSETLLHELANRGVYISSGSACAKGHKSHVLAAMELDEKRIDSALRISFSNDSSKEDADALINALGECMKTLVRAS